MKTPEQISEEEADRIERHAILCVSLLAMNDGEYFAAKKAYKAGYQAAKDTYKDAISTYEEVAKQMLEEAVRIMSPKDQLVDAGKVMNSPNNSNGWISVKERLPEIDKYVLITHRISQNYTSLKVMEGCRISDDQYEIWGDHAILADYVDYWMPLPEAPRGEG